MAGSILAAVIAFLIALTGSISLEPGQRSRETGEPPAQARPLDSIRDPHLVDIEKLRAAVEAILERLKARVESAQGQAAPDGCQTERSSSDTWRSETVVCSSRQVESDANGGSIAISSSVSVSTSSSGEP